MKRTLVAMLFVAVALKPARAGEIDAGAARAVVAPFYQALNAAFGKDSADLIRQATAGDWVSCRGNDVCNSRDEVIAGIAQRLKSVPDLKWEIKDVLVAGDQVIVRGEATGTPAGEFLGAPYAGRSFRVMSIDVHTIAGGRMARSYHIEDWIGAVRQLTAK
jgi:predicted ester cyclase